MFGFCLFISSLEEEAVLRGAAEEAAEGDLQEEEEAVEDLPEEEEDSSMRLPLEEEEVKQLANLPPVKEEGRPWEEVPWREARLLEEEEAS